MLATFNWQSLILGSVILNVIGSTLTKYQVNRASSFQVLIYKYIASASLMTGLWLLTSRQLPSLWPIMFIYGFFGGINVAAYTAAMRHSMSQSAMAIPIKRLLGIIWAGLILGEFSLFNISSSKGRLMFLGLILMLVVFAAFFEKGKEIIRWQKLIWAHVLVASFVLVVAKIFLKENSAISVLMPQYWGSLTSAVLMAKLRMHKIYLGKRFAVRGLLHGFINSSGIILWFSALAITSATEVTLLRAPITVTMATVIGLFGFKESKKLTARKIVGILAAMGVLLVSLFLS